VARINLTREEFLKKAKEIHGDKYDYSLITEDWWRKNFKFISKTKIPIICKVHGCFYQIIRNHLKGKNCPICSNSTKLTQKEFLRRAKEIHGDKYDYSLITEEWWQKNYKGSKKTSIKIICNKHGIFKQRVFNHLIGSGCPKCAKNLQLTREEFLKKAKEIHGDKYDYSLITEDWWKENYKNTHVKIPIICSKHEVFYQKVNDHLNYHGCSKCQISKGEIKIENYLIKNNINYIYQYKIKYQDRNFYFDFYLPELNLAIEYDGIFHFESPSEIFENEVQKQKERDKLKDQYCQENDINLLRIPYWDFKKIDEILENEINKFKEQE